jgi:NAD(P)-dependent dehydrogenase (short-subunit alcohol dehydrogenase family)
VTSDQEDPPARAERVAIVTGAGGGLGSAVARLLAETREYRLCLVDNRRDAVEAVATELRALGAEAQALEVDLGAAEAAESVVPRTIDRFGRVDALVNAAAILHRRDFDAVTPKDFDEVFHVNTLAPLLLARAAMPDMASRGWGRIVNVTSTGVYEGGFTMTSALYEASKGAVAVLTKMLSRHGAGDGILVNTVCPGGMRTGMLLNETSAELVAKAEREMIPLHRIADPAEIGRMIVWLVSDLNTYATGAEFDITGGLALH